MSFQTLFKDYFKEFGFNITEKGFTFMDTDISKHNIQLILLYLEQEAIGFATFQIDTLDNPWCMNEEAGDIREFYISPKYRLKGYSKHLFQAIKAYFESRQIYDIYLTSDDSGLFWKKLGFTPTGKVIEENHSEEYVYHIAT